MQGNLMQMEQEALQSRERGDLVEAVKLYLAIVDEEPAYEQGMIFFDLAGCYEDLGKIELAMEAYRRAAIHGKGDPTIVGGLASFLYLHGDPREAMERYLELLKIENKAKDTDGIQSTKEALEELAKRAGVSEEFLTNKIREALEAPV